MCVGLIDCKLHARYKDASRAFSPPVVAWQCGYALTGVRSLGRDRFELVSSRRVRFDAFSHIPTPCFGPQPSHITFEDINKLIGAQIQFLTHRLPYIFQAFCAEVTRSISRHDPVLSVYLSKRSYSNTGPACFNDRTQKATRICRS